MNAVYINPSDPPHPSIFSHLIHINICLLTVRVFRVASLLLSSIRYSPSRYLHKPFMRIS